MYNPVTLAYSHEFMANLHTKYSTILYYKGRFELAYPDLTVCKDSFFLPTYSKVSKPYIYIWLVFLLPTKGQHHNPE